MSAGQAETGGVTGSGERGWLGSVAEGEELGSNILRVAQVVVEALKSTELPYEASWRRSR
jgi:hypothetical protein